MERGTPPSTILILSGDVHHGYLAEATLSGGADSSLYQAVCSPLRNVLPSKKSYLQSHAWTKTATLAARLLAHLAGVPSEPLAWRLIHDARFFENHRSPLWSSKAGAPPLPSRRPSSTPRKNLL